MSKNYADVKRKANFSDIQIGDKVLLPKLKDNKLSCNFEDQPVTVVAKQGSAISVQTPAGVKMRNSAHVKKFKEPLCNSEVQNKDIVQNDLEPVKQLDISVQSAPTTVQSSDEPIVQPDPPRVSTRIRSQPVWMKDYVST